MSCLAPHKCVHLIVNDCQVIPIPLPLAATSRLHCLQPLQWLPWLPWRGHTVLRSPPTLHKQPPTSHAWGRVHPHPHWLR